MARQWLETDLGQDVALTEEQERQLADKLAGRLMDRANANGREAQALFEYAFQGILETKGRPFSREQCIEFGDRAGPLVPEMRELLKGLRARRPAPGDRRPVGGGPKPSPPGLPPPEPLRRHHGPLADGGLREGEDLFREIQKADDPEDEQRSNAPAPAVRRARRQAERELRRLGTARWETFLRSAASFFAFTDEQTGEGQRILAEHRGRARAIMTPEWRTACQRNRTLFALRWSLGKEPIAPWVYRLERDWGRLIGPLNEIEGSFFDAILAIPTGEQRENALATLRARAADHGIELETVDRTVLRLDRRK